VTTHPVNVVHRGSYTGWKDVTDALLAIGNDASGDPKPDEVRLTIFQAYVCWLESICPAHQPHIQ
jgi:hypothetical protein